MYKHLSFCVSKIHKFSRSNMILIADFEFLSWGVVFLNWATHCKDLHLIQQKRCILLLSTSIGSRPLCPESSATGMGQFPICKLKWDLLRTSVTACTIDKITFSAPFGIFYMRTEIWKKKFQKISYTTPQWGASHLQTPVSKWELP